MWFQNLRVYQFTKPFILEPKDLELAMEQYRVVPCGSHEKSRYGWTSPLGEDSDMLIHVSGCCIMICSQKQEKLLPTTIVTDAANERILELEKRQGDRVSGKQKRRIREDIFMELLPRAFVRNQQIFAYIDTTENVLVVNSSSANKSEELLNLLRETLGSLPVEMLDPQKAPSELMTLWLRERKASDNFVIDEDCELFCPLIANNTVRLKGQDLQGDEIGTLLDAGKKVKMLGVTWNSYISCCLCDDLTIKRLRFIGIGETQEQVESEVDRFDQDFAVMTVQLQNFINALYSVFGVIKL
jgi:recombination associated protein RdgC